MHRIEPIAGRIDQQLAEVDHLISALIFISENVETHQHELLRHTAVTIGYCLHDKISEAGRDVTRLHQLSRENGHRTPCG